MPTISKSKALQLGIPKKSLQTILFNKIDWNVPSAKKWLKEHNYINNGWRRTKNEIRFIQVNPIEDATYYSKKLSDGIILVYQQY